MTAADVLESTKDFRELNRLFRRRVAKTYYADHEVQVVDRGGIYRARFAGCAVSTFGESAQQAMQRLLAMGNTPIKPKYDDRIADRLENGGNRP
jgi:hypothetical protein